VRSPPYGKKPGLEDILQSLPEIEKINPVSGAGSGCDREHNVGVRHPQMIGDDRKCLYRRAPVIGGSWGMAMQMRSSLGVGAIARLR